MNKKTSKSGKLTISSEDLGSLKAGAPKACNENATATKGSGCPTNSACYTDAKTHKTGTTTGAAK